MTGETEESLLAKGRAADEVVQGWGSTIRWEHEPMEANRCVWNKVVKQRTGKQQCRRGKTQ